MDILLKFLIVVGILIAIILIIVLFLLIYPFKYTINLSYVDNDKIELVAKYIIFRVKGFILFKPSFDYELKLWNKTLIKNKKDDKHEKNSIDDTDFIKDKNIDNQVVTSKKNIKSLFENSKKLKEYVDSKNIVESEKTKSEKIKKANEKIDNIFGFLPTKKLYALKRIVKEGIYALNVIKPNKCELKINYGNSDPYMIGLVSAFAAPFYSIVGDDISIKPNFNNEFISGNILLCGRPMLIRLIKPILSLFFDKKFKNAIKN